MSDQLRTAAELRAGGPTPTNADELDKLVHDLRVHQIELEMQNEELRATQERLEDTKEEYVRLYNDAPVGYLSLDSAGIIRRCNKTFEEMMGLEAGLILNRPLADFLGVGDKEVFLARYRAFFKQPSGKDFEVSLRHKNGETPVRLTGRPDTRVPADSQKHGDGLLVMVYDITEQAQAASQIKALLTEKELLLREIHHRVKNNLSTVISLLSMRSEQQDHSTCVNVVDEAKNRVETMLMVYQLLHDGHSSRLVNLREYLDGLLEKIASVCAPDNLVAVERDVCNLQLDSATAVNLGILMNELVTNAYKYAFEPGTSGTIRVAARELENRRLALMVEDNGRGFPEGFNPAQSDGFGLAVVEGLCSQMNGSYEIIPLEPGARFAVELELD